MGLVTAALLATASAVAATAGQDLSAMHRRLGILAVRDTLAAHGERPGQGMRVAVIDDGFCLRHRGLARLQASGIVDSWDYLRKLSPAWDTVARTSHGSATLGVLASDWDSLPGIVPAANFLLYRTEVDSFERLSEGTWLAEAIDRAVDSGAGVISISLGYRYYIDSVGDLPWSQFDGKTRPESVAAARATARGAVVVAAMGNDASLPAPNLGAPADADGILSVAAVDTSLVRCSFSSVGNTYDGRIKPDLAAFGCSVPTVDASDTDGIIDYSGTSFAAPLVAGMAVLVRQLHPDWTPSEVIASLKSSASQASRPDSLLGWGVPDLHALAAASGIANRSALRRSSWRLDAAGRLMALSELGAGRLEVFDASGRSLAAWDLGALARGQALLLPSAARGVLLVRWHAAGRIETSRVVRP